jgi:hypothetical protein
MAVLELVAALALLILFFVVGFVLGAIAHHRSVLRVLRSMAPLPPLVGDDDADIEVVRAHVDTAIEQWKADGIVEEVER